MGKSVLNDVIELDMQSVNPNGQNLYTIHVKFLFGRRKIKYEIVFNAKPRTRLIMMYAFSSIQYVQFSKFL